MDENRFFIGVLLAVAGASFVVGLHELDVLLTLAAPVVVLTFLSLAAGALLAALGGKRLALRASLTMLVVAYALLLAAAWFRFLTDPSMFEETEPDGSVVLRYERT